MIEADFAEFIDDDERARGRGIAEQTVQEARFSGAKKTGDNRGKARAASFDGVFPRPLSSAAARQEKQD